MHKLAQAVLVFILFMTFAISALAQTRVEATTSGGFAGINYRFLFENEKFITQRQEIQFDQTGHGQYSFKKKGNDEISNRLEVSQELVAQIQSLLGALNFLESSEDYQHKKDFSHLGTITFTHARGGRERTVKLNYTINPAMSRLVDIFRNIATQEERVFELQSVRQNDPISTPAQLRMLESELKSRRIAEPRRLTPLLEEIRTDESVPLIARNHAERLLKSIRTGK
jgi:hypothetical protein